MAPTDTRLRPLSSSLSAAPPSSPGHFRGGQFCRCCSFLTICDSSPSSSFPFRLPLLSAPPPYTSPPSDASVSLLVFGSGDTSRLSGREPAGRCLIARYAVVYPPFMVSPEYGMGSPSNLFLPLFVWSGTLTSPRPRSVDQGQV